MKSIKKALIVIGFIMIAGVAFRMLLAQIEANQAKARFPIREQCTNFEDALHLYKEIHGYYPSVTNGLEILFNDEGCKKLLKNTNLLIHGERLLDINKSGANFPKVDSAGRTENSIPMTIFIRFIDRQHPPAP
jgi:hypothetical protein